VEKKDCPEAIVVLGCAVRLDATGRLTPGTLARRLDAAARSYESTAPAAPDAFVIASGGRRWGAAVEADVMARELAARGVPPAAIVRERCSLSTRDNARFSAELLARRGVARAAIVTSAWHLPRALSLFSLAGVDGQAVEAEGDAREAPLARVWHRVRERVVAWADARAVRRARVIAGGR
jgi:uncharacterized SAM-binding protein YcdF (DUF218 family)